MQSISIQDLSKEVHDLLIQDGYRLYMVATGGAANLQQSLWQYPGSSKYLAGASFPYSMEAQEKFLGFKPESSCSESNAMDLAMAAYMEAVRADHQAPLGLAVTASVATNAAHRGDHRAWACLVTPNLILVRQVILTKGTGGVQRALDNDASTMLALSLLKQYLTNENLYIYLDDMEKATTRFFLRPFFTADGKRLPASTGKFAIMSGAYNPPHQGHFGMAEAFHEIGKHQVLFEICAKAPHKDALPLSELLRRSALLSGKNRIFTQDTPLYLDKAKKFPNSPIILGADAMLRMLDPSWGIQPEELMRQFKELGTTIYVTGRLVEDKFLSRQDIIKLIPEEYHDMIFDLEGRWDISSTFLRSQT